MSYYVKTKLTDSRARFYICKDEKELCFTYNQDVAKDTCRRLNDAKLMKEVRGMFYPA